MFVFVVTIGKHSSLSAVFDDVHKLTKHLLGGEDISDYKVWKLSTNDPAVGNVFFPLSIEGTEVMWDMGGYKTDLIGRLI